MPSAALQRWNTTRLGALDEIEQAHGAVGGGGRGRRYATLQVNHAYAVLLSSQFQGYCRDLQSEAVDLLVSNTLPPAVAAVLRVVMTQGRRLDAGNPNPGNIGSDFARLGLDLWGGVAQVDARKNERLSALDDLNLWRNAIAHQDWSKVPGNQPDLRLAAVRRWRSVCHGLARSFDRAVERHLVGMVGTRPW
jgi:hypothetical protein